MARRKKKKKEVGPTVRKSLRRKRRRKDRMDKKVFCSHMNRTSISYAQGAKC